jgi:nicotinate-nucleotide adenylyltransferase
MRVAIYGGSFNPPHIGHLMVSAWLRWTARCEQVWWVPVHGHAFAKDLVAFDERVALCRAATAEMPDVEILEIERELPVPSYTIDTLHELSRRHPGTSFRLVVGADVLQETHRWKDWAGISRDFDPIVVGRQGFPTPPGTVDFPGVSSTEIRRRAAAGEPMDELVPAAILARVRALYSGMSAMLP